MTDHDDPTRPDGPTSPGPDPSGRGAAELEAELAAAREEARLNHDPVVRERADLDNLRKRGRTGATRRRPLRNEALARDVLTIIDDLERALTAAGGGGGNGKPLVEGVELVRKAFLETLQRHGVERVTATGERFDPQWHEAVAYVESDTEPQRVIEEHRAGYRLNDRLLRPAMVTVSKGKSGAAKLANEEGGG
jgi:molecular chaperone GrpE